MTYVWKYYLLAAHLVDENGRTACNRRLPQVDKAVGEVPEKRKCKTCQKYALKFKEVLCPMLEGYVLATRCKGCSREATCPKEPKTALEIIVKEGSGEKKNEI